MKRIAFFSGDITRTGGTERVGSLIANALSRRGGYEVYMVSLTHGCPAPGFELDPQIRREALSDHWVRPGPGYVPLIFRLKKYVNENGIALIIDIDGVLDVLSIPVKWMTGLRVVSWEHFNFYENAGTFYRPIIRRLAARHADAIVTLTRQDAGFYKENLNIRHEIRAIHNPADYMAGHADAAGRAMQNADRKILLSVGGLVRPKRFDRVPRIAKKIKEKHPGIDFVWEIAGEGPERENIEREIDASNVRGNVRLLGYVADVEALYASAYIYVMTSEREGLPMVLLEAKQYGLPSVSFDIRTGPSEIIADNVNGCLIPMTNDEEDDADAMATAIGRLLADEGMWRSFSDRAKLGMEEFSMERVAGQWEELIGELLDGGRR